MSIFPNELRLGITVALNAMILLGGYRLAKRFGEDSVQALVDAFLLWYLVQYVVIGALGMMGLLGGTSIVLAGGLLGAALWVIAEKWMPRHAQMVVDAPPRTDAIVFHSCLIVVLGYCAGVIYVQRHAPTIANDPLTYHLPAAVQWLQRGRIDLFPVWFYNPANTYSPLAGSMFAAWLMGPLGNDVLARFVEAPALVFLFLAAVRLSIALGAPLRAAALIGLSLACARPFTSQLLVAKDDVVLAAFFAAALAALPARNSGKPIDAARLGVALGLFFATKYTALFTVPAMVLLVDAPWRGGWRWRNQLIALGMAVALAGPWYLRNLIVCHNPVFPADVSIFGQHVFSGLFTTLPSKRLRGASNVWHAVTGGYYGLPPAATIPLMVVWLVTLFLSRGSWRRDPLARCCLLGAPLCIALFVAKSPYDEMRFVYPSLILLFVGPALLFRRRALIGWIAVSAVAIPAILTGFTLERIVSIFPFIAVAIAILTAGSITWCRLMPRLRLGAAMLTVAAVTALVYVEWPSYLGNYQVSSGYLWSNFYGKLADGWAFVEERTEPDCTIAYANTFYVYPLQGFDLRRHVIYAPSRPGVRDFRDLPHLSNPVSGEDLPWSVARLTTEGSDRATWLANLEASGAQYLFIGKRDLTDSRKQAEAPELGFATTDPAHFERMFANDAVEVFRVRLR